MKFEDRVYATQVIEEPILIELIETPKLQRLKGISQFGMPESLYRFPVYSRFEHSIGVMLLLRQLGASLEEQAAGLLHDVSHTAFSHTVDWVYGTETEENHQDEALERIILNSSLPSILERHGLDARRIVNQDLFPLLEQEAPLLCADRVDYTLREMALYKDPENVEFVKKSLIANKRIMFNNREAAEIFAKDYMGCQLNHWGAPLFKTRWRLLADALKLGILEGTIVYDDFYTDDATVLEKLGKSKNPDIIRNFELLEEDFGVIEDSNGPFEIKKKFRYVDPEFVENGQVYRYSEINPCYGNFLKVEAEKARQSKNVRIIFQ
tara:strand:- start:165 stop:1133 length:969 start_codon:yes stop_codon:yes gene_type:complete